MASSSIEWTELTWNPTTGCDKVSAGCKFCYAEIMSRRLKAMGVEKCDKSLASCDNRSIFEVESSSRAARFINSGLAPIGGVTSVRFGYVFLQGCRGRFSRLEPGNPHE